MLMRGVPSVSRAARACAGPLLGRRGRPLALLALVAGALAMAAAIVPTVAGAYATILPAPSYSSATGLPDGRVYEQVTPRNKYGNEVGHPGFGSTPAFGNAAADGDSVLYPSDGALTAGAISGNSNVLYVSRRSSDGWTTRSAMPEGIPGSKNLEENNGYFAQVPHWLYPSADLSHLAFLITGADVQGHGGGGFLAGEDPLVEPAWIAAGDPKTLVPVGASADLSTIYFSTGSAFSEFFEYSNGVFRQAGVLPGGSVSPFGARPAAGGIGESAGDPVNPAQLNNQVSLDGSQAFFVSPDPEAVGACTASNSGPGGCVPQLYVRERNPDGTQRTTLVSQSQLPGHVGQPALDGPLAVLSPVWQGGAAGSGGGPSAPFYVYASPDGSHAFFQSADRLTVSAPEGSAPKAYSFDTETGVLEYLPGVAGSIVAAAGDGSSFLFEDTALSPVELDRWSTGPEGGRVTSIAQLPAPPQIGRHGCAVLCVGPVRVSSDGSVAVFTTSSAIAGFNDDGGFWQIFRYDATSNDLSCVSCPPAGITPSGDAIMSRVDEGQILNNPAESFGEEFNLADVRGVSPDGSRVLFDTSDPLVARDVNGRQDVYEWENGTVYLLSSGTDSQDSVFLDSSESGGDVFFETAAGIGAGDLDGAYDVYDARVPRPGDNPPPAAVPCSGDVCQGPPSAPQLLGEPSSETFSGIGNLAPEASPPPAKAKVKSAGKRKAKRTPNKRRRGRKSSRSRRARKSDRRGKR